MNSRLLPVTLVAALGFGSAALALTDTSTIANVDTVSDTVTLTDGSIFVFNDEVYADRLNSFKPGDQVVVSYHHVGTKLEADAISPVNAAYTGGQAVEYPDHAIDHLD